ncbi:type IV pili methyl-accepting chemotaxis transducer N-terminal domain-containing protein [Cupriavidus sp. SIMBA_020]|uniref:type IV pili methyl-accepting chemotaxis transducer N-terminal domain-containing protein n=1 Tax=Cupriavidus sp. SIMBA_020 TaxID=3085766 RepID=UPI00397B7D7A
MPAPFPDAAFDTHADPQATSAVGLPGLRHRLSTRIISLSLISLLVVLTMIGGTLWLSWNLEGAGAAINDAGSVRMHANAVAIELTRARAHQPHALAPRIAQLDETLAQLRRGDAKRPLFLPAVPAIHDQLDRVARAWDERMKPLAEQDINAPDGTPPAYVAALSDFVAQANQLVRMIEADNARKTDLLRMSQAALAAIACMGTVAVIYLLYLWIILPVLTLQDGLRRMAAREFSLRLPVTSRDEFGTLSTGFNRMAAELQELYRGLEARVAQKTAELARRNRDLETLYDIAAYLNQPNEAEALCRGFLTRIMRRLDADGGSVRMLDAVPENLHMVVSEGLPAALIEQEQRMAADACHCGAATRQRVVTWPAPPHAQPSPPMACGFGGFAAFRIDTPRGVIGMFSLHFRSPRVLNASDRQLLETLAQHLGVALEHQRLSATARQLAVVEERNLVAQGLHDSIAQGLNYLNLQAQLLEEAVSRGALADVAAIVPMLRCGVDESYQDVRELLLNFRTRLTQGELRQAAEDTVARFRRQCATEARLEVEGYDNARPLPPDAQLQVLFVLQEALSNVRKHAQAGHVLVRLRGGRDLELVVQDDGEGFDAAGLATRCEMQVGLHIMRERAARLNAQLSIESAPGRGTRVALRVPGAHVSGEASEASEANEINEMSLQS